MKKSVINEEKLEERILNPSKDVPDVLENGDVMTIYWTLINGEPYSFVTIEEVYGDEPVDEGEMFAKPHAFRLYGAIYGKIYPWQVDLADLDGKSRILAICKAKSLPAAQVLLFEKADEVMETIANGKKEGASLLQKTAAWKVLRHIEALYDEAKLKASWFTSRHGGTIEKLMDGLLSEEEMSLMEFDFEALQCERRSLKRNASKTRVGQLALGMSF